MKRLQTSARILALGLTVALLSSAQVEGGSQWAINRAHRFLSPGERGKEILEYVHLGAQYLSREYIATVPLEDGNFALFYEFKWRTTGDGFTDIAFACDGNGNLYKLAVTKTNAEFNQPFLLANASIKVLGSFLIAEYKDKLKDDTRKLLLKIVDDADAHKLLEWSLKLEQFFGK
jgi:hypothetical protein